VGDLPGALMQLRRMLKPDRLLSRLTHACGVIETQPARVAKKRSIATVILGDTRFESPVPMKAVIGWSAL
jgi:hypothetical protein